MDQEEEIVEDMIEEYLSKTYLISIKFQCKCFFVFLAPLTTFLGESSIWNPA